MHPAHQFGCIADLWIKLARRVAVDLETATERMYTKRTRAAGILRSGECTQNMNAANGACRPRAAFGRGRRAHDREGSFRFESSAAWRRRWLARRPVSQQPGDDGRWREAVILTLWACAGSTHVQKGSRDVCGLCGAHTCQDHTPWVSTFFNGFYNTLICMSFEYICQRPASRGMCDETANSRGRVIHVGAPRLTQTRHAKGAGSDTSAAIHIRTVDSPEREFRRSGGRKAAVRGCLCI